MFCISPLSSFRSNAILLFLPVSKYYSTENNQNINNFYNNNKKNLRKTRNTAANKTRRILFTTNHRRDEAELERDVLVTSRSFSLPTNHSVVLGRTLRSILSQKNSLHHRNKCCLPILTVWNGISNFPLAFRTTARFSTAMEKNRRESTILTT